MKKIIKLTESDLTRVIKKIISESKKAPSLQKVYNKIYQVLEDMKLSKFNDDFDIGYVQSDSSTNFPGPARNYGKYVGTYLFKVSLYLEDDVNIEMISKKVIDELNNEFGNEFFELGGLRKKNFLINFNKLALVGA